MTRDKRKSLMPLRHTEIEPSLLTPLSPEKHHQVQTESDQLRW